MRIAYVFDQLLPSSETDGEQAINTIGGLVRQGASVTLFLPRHPGVRPPTGAELADYYQVDAGFDVRCLRSLHKPRAAEKIGHAVRAGLSPRLRGFDLVHTRNVSGLLGLVALGHPVVYETYRPWATEYPWSAPAFRWATSRKNFVGALVHSAYAKSEYVRIGIDPDLIEVVYNGYEPSRMEPRRSRADARAELGLPDDKPLVVYTGRVSVGKGLGVVLDMAARLPDVNFLLVGSEGDGEIEQRSRTMDNVIVHPWQSFDALPGYLYAADILLLPPSMIPLQQSKNTVLPMKLFLYLAAGRPLLAPRSPDTAELLTHDDNAWLVDPDDAGAASAAVSTLVSDRALADRLANRAREGAADLTWQARGRRILDFVRRRI